MERQERYADDGVHGYWYAAKMPRIPWGLRRTFGDGTRLSAHPDLPMFPLTIGAGEGVDAFTVAAHGEPVPLAAHVAALLDGRVYFRRVLTADGTQRSRLSVYRRPCPRCRHSAYYYWVTGLRSQCGLPLCSSTGLGLELGLRPDVLGHANRSNDIPVAIRPFVIEQASGVRDVACPQCHRVVRVGDAAYLSDDLVGGTDISLYLGAPVHQDYPHWCYAPSGEPCPVVPTEAEREAEMTVRAVATMTQAFMSDTRAAIMRGCDRAGCDTLLDVEENGWTADVLATTPRGRAAFIAGATLEPEATIRERTVPYAAARVAPMWLCRDDGIHRAWQVDNPGLRLFRLARSGYGGIDVHLYGTVVPLDDFVAALLSGRIRRQSAVIATYRDLAKLEFFPFRCYKPGCGRWSHVYDVTHIDIIPVGPVPPVRCAVPTSAASGPTRRPASDVFAPDIVTAVRTFLASPPGRRLCCSLGKRRLKWASAPVWSLGCYHCNAVFGSTYIESARLRDRVDATLDVSLGGPYETTFIPSHWCYPRDGLWCGE